MRNQRFSINFLLLTFLLLLLLPSLFTFEGSGFLFFLFNFFSLVYSCRLLFFSVYPPLNDTPNFSHVRAVIGLLISRA